MPNSPPEESKHIEFLHYPDHFGHFFRIGRRLDSGRYQFAKITFDDKAPQDLVPDEYNIPIDTDYLHGLYRQLSTIFKENTNAQ